ITRHDLINQLSALHHSIELADVCGDKRSDFRRKQISAIQRIRQQVLSTRDYQDRGKNIPCWQDVRTTAKNAAKGLDLGSIRLDLAIDGVEVYADSLLPKVFYNILDNTIRHSETAGRISISCHPAKDTLVIVIEDNGCGIAPAEKRRIFQKGYGRNTGFGLFLCTEILQMTGITISENGTPRRGARFEMVVPGQAFRYSAEETPAESGPYHPVSQVQTS
ncbi:MAG: PAS domain S-box protein, partial [Methanomicrobiales archaeon]|nr:PAS domain S-box protein [Methanomicrobiales archaeon]